MFTLDLKNSFDSFDINNQFPNSHKLSRCFFADFLKRFRDSSRIHEFNLFYNGLTKELWKIIGQIRLLQILIYCYVLEVFKKIKISKIGTENVTFLGYGPYRTVSLIRVIRIISFLIKYTWYFFKRIYKKRWKFSLDFI